MSRRTDRSSKSVTITVKVPRDMIPAINRVVKYEDSDRSKFIRRAIRERISNSTGELVSA